MHIVLGIFGLGWFAVGLAGLYDGVVVGAVFIGAAAIVERLGAIHAHLVHDTTIRIQMHRAEHPELHGKPNLTTR